MKEKEEEAGAAAVAEDEEIAAAPAVVEASVDAATAAAAARLDAAAAAAIGVETFGPMFALTTAAAAAAAVVVAAVVGIVTASLCASAPAPPALRFAVWECRWELELAVKEEEGEDNAGMVKHASCFSPSPSR